MNPHRFQNIRTAALACAVLAGAASTPARADSYDWWLFDQIELTMNQARAEASRARQEKPGPDARAETPPPKRNETPRPGSEAGAAERPGPMTPGPQSARPQPAGDKARETK
jgi:hypothetical protein